MKNKLVLYYVICAIFGIIITLGFWLLIILALIKFIWG